MQVASIPRITISLAGVVVASLRLIPARNAIPTISSRLGMLVITCRRMPRASSGSSPPIHLTGADGDWTQVPTGSVVSFPISIADGGTGETTATLGFDALSPLTTTGDTLCFGATHNVRVAGQHHDGPSSFLPRLAARLVECSPPPGGDRRHGSA